MRCNECGQDVTLVERQGVLVLDTHRRQVPGGRFYWCIGDTESAENGDSNV